MTYNEKKKAYNQQYTKDNYKHVHLLLAYDKYDQVKAAADKQNESVNGYIKKAIDDRLSNEDPSG